MIFMQIGLVVNNNNSCTITIHDDNNKRIYHKVFEIDSNLTNILVKLCDIYKVTNLYVETESYSILSNNNSNDFLNKYILSNSTLRQLCMN